MSEAWKPCWLLLLSICCGFAYGQSPEKEIFAETFEGDPARWKPFTAASRWAVVGEENAGGDHSVRVDGNGDRSAIRAGEVRLSEPLPTVLVCTYRGRCGRGDPHALIGVELKIVLDDGSIAWFLPESLRLIPTHAERWVERRSSFVADSPRRIRAFEVICVNYDSTVPAWFDNIRVAAATAGRTTGAIAFIQRANDPQSDWKSARDALANTGQRCEVVPSYADFSAAKLLIVPEWEEDQQFYWRSKLHHYFGGRLLLRELPASQWARALASYLWDEPPERLRGAIRVSTDGRAVHVPKNVAIAPETLAVLLRSESRLPANLPMRDYGPKPVRQIREGCLYVGDRPLLLRAVGCYDAPGNVSLDEHERVLAEYDRLGFNGLVLYVPWSFDEARFAAFLAVARRHGMHLMIWMHGPAAGAYSEKPLKDEWVFRALQFCQHPAILGWILCDDTFHHHMSFVSREAEVFRRYDRTNLVTATLMDPRAPSRVSEEGWKRWRDILDFR